MILDLSNINDLRKQIQKIRKDNPKEQIIVLAKDEEFNRKVVELKDVDILLSPEIHERRDRLKQRDSGLNEVLCNLARENRIKIGIDINKIKKLKDEEKPIILSRIKQNIMLSKKAGCDIIILGTYDKKDAFSLLITLGASTQQAKKAIEKEV
jgi:RNase P/RNase MRP subunit p30